MAKKSKPITLDTTTKLIRLASSLWPDDQTRPGLTLAFVAGQFYGSIVRYRGQLGTGRIVQYKCRAATLPEIIRELARQILDDKSLVDDLKEAL